MQPYAMAECENTKGPNLTHM